MHRQKKNTIEHKLGHKKLIGSINETGSTTLRLHNTLSIYMSESLQYP